MKHFVLAPDSFKGTMDAQLICKLEKEAITARFPDAKVTCIPMADGGEGMVSAYMGIMGGETVSVTVTGPLGAPVEAVYGILPDGSAVMEMAAAAGLPYALGHEDPMHTTTYGVGQMILHAKAQGVKKILLGLGGSATNDCGIGMAAALGWRFLDDQGREVEPLACNLGKIHTILEPEVPLDLQIRAACDVDNPLLGSRGATYTFGPQKGATEEMLPLLEAGMTGYARVLEAHKNLPGGTEAPGSGAAGGMGAAVRMLFGGELLAGAELLLDSVGFDSLLQEADFVFTGEGRMDWQSAYGKVPGAIARRCQKAKVPCIALCGALGQGAEKLYDIGVTAMFSAVRGACSFEQIQKTCQEDLSLLTASVLRLL